MWINCLAELIYQNLFVICLPCVLEFTNSNNKKKLGFWNIKTISFILVTLLMPFVFNGCSQNFLKTLANLRKTKILKSWNSKGLLLQKFTLAIFYSFKVFPMDLLLLQFYIGGDWGQFDPPMVFRKMYL